MCQLFEWSDAGFESRANRWFLPAEWENPHPWKPQGCGTQLPSCCDDLEGNSGVGDFYAGGAEDFAFVGLLDEGDDSEIFGVRVGLQFDGYVL
jgi:hypothetical protein